MPVDWPPVVRSVVAVLPPMAALTVALGPYDGYFEDRRIFLFFLGGLALGLVVGVLEVSLLLTSGEIHPFFYVLGTPLVSQLGKTVVLNLPRFQGDPGNVFHGASLGAGVAMIVVLGYGNTTAFLDPARLASTGLTLAVLGTGVALLHVTTGAVIGDHVARGTPFRGLGIATAASVPVAFGVFAHLFFRALPLDRAVWGVLTLAYGLLLFAYLRREVLDRGLTDDQRRRRRREIRGAS